MSIKACPLPEEQNIAANILPCWPP